MVDTGQPARRDINRYVFRLFLLAVLVADYVVLAGKQPFAS